MKKKTKVLLTILILFLALILTGKIIVNNFLDQYIEKKVGSILENNFNNYYKFSFSQTENQVSGFSISFSISDVKVTSDTSMVKLRKKYPAYFGSLQKMEINELNWFNLFYRDQLEINSIDINSPNLNVINYRKTKIADSIKNKKAKNAELESALFITEAELNNFNITDGNFTWYQNDTLVSSVKYLDVNLVEAKVDFEQLDLISKAIVAKDLVYHANDILFYPAKGLYKYVIKESFYELDSNRIELYGLKLEPFNDNLWGLTDSVNKQQTLFDISIDTLLLDEISLAEIFEKKMYSLHQIDVIGLDAKMVRNGTKTFLHKNRPMYAELLQKLDVDFHVDNIQIKNSKLKFEILPPKSDEIGVVKLDQVNASIKNIGNKKNDTIHLTLNALLYNAAPFHFNATIPVWNKQQKQTYSGSIKNMDMRLFNDLVSKSMGVEIKSGYLSNMTFDGSMTSTESNGVMEMEYKDLSILFLNRNDEKKRKYNKVVSLLASSVLRKDNLKENKNFHVGHYNYKRNPEKDQIDFWINSILAGIEKSAIKVNLDGLK